MKRLLVIGLVSLVSACTSASGAAQNEADAVRAVGLAWMAAYEAGDYAAIPELYTEDTMVMPRGRPRIEGRAALSKALGGLAAGRKVQIDITERELVVDGDLAWYISDFRVTYGRPTDATPQRTEFGRSLIIYKKGGDGRWRVHRDIDSPAPTPAS